MRSWPPPGSGICALALTASAGATAIPTTARRALCSSVLLLADGERLYDEGSDAVDVFLVRDGAVTLHRGAPAGDGERIGEKRPGELVGESAALDRLPRTVSARARGAATVDVLSAERFRDLLQGDAPACYEVAVALARTLRTAGTPPA